MYRRWHSKVRAAFSLATIVVMMVGLLGPGVILAQDATPTTSANPMGEQQAVTSASNESSETTESETDTDTETDEETTTEEETTGGSDGEESDGGDESTTEENTSTDTTSGNGGETEGDTTGEDETGKDGAGDGQTGEDNTDGATASPDDPEGESEQQTDDIGSTPLANTDAITADAANPAEITLAPGASQQYAFTYNVTTPRTGTALHAEVRNADGSLADGWLVDLQVDGASGATGPAADQTETSTTTPDSTFSFIVAVQAPAKVTAAQTVTLAISSTAATDAGDEPALAGDTVLATITVEPPPAPQVNTDSFTLDDDLATPVEFKAGGEEQTIHYTYHVTTDRAATTITATLTDAKTGDPAKSWVVVINGQGATDVTNTNEFTDADAVGAGSTISLAITVASDATAEYQGPSGSVTLTLTSAVKARADEKASATEASAQLQLAVAEPVFSPAVVTDGSYLDCDNANQIFTVDDSIVPGQVLEFDCRYPLGSLAILPTMTGTISLTAPTGWQIAVQAANLSALNLPAGVISTQTDFGAGPISFSVTSALTLVSGNMLFTVLLRAPLEPILTSQTATVTVDTSCSGISLGGGSCGVSAVTDSATLTAEVQMTSVSSGGGQLLGTVTILGLSPGTLLMQISCDAPLLYGSGTAVPNYTVAPGQSAYSNCTLRSLAALNALAGAIDLSTTITKSQSAAGWSTALASGHDAEIGSGAVSLDLSNLAKADLLAGVPFTLFFTPDCSAVTGSPINAVEVSGSFALTVGGLTIPVSPAYANVPVQVSGTAVYTKPTVSGQNLDFGSASYNGTGYPDMNATLTMTVNQPATGCKTPGWAVQIATSDMTGDAHAQTIPANDITFTSATSSDTNLTALTNVQLGTTATTVASGTDAVADGATLNANFTLSPPDDAAADHYQGTITFTTFQTSP